VYGGALNYNIEKYMEMAGILSVFVVSLNLKSVVNSVFGSGSAALRRGALLPPALIDRLSLRRSSIFTSPQRYRPPDQRNIVRDHPIDPHIQ